MTSRKLYRIVYKEFLVAEALNEGSCIKIFKDLPKEILKLPYLLSDLRIFCEDWGLAGLSFKVLDDELFLFQYGKTKATFRKPLEINEEGFIKEQSSDALKPRPPRFWLFMAYKTELYRGIFKE